jgi:Rieske Fe-S protein
VIVVNGNAQLWDCQRQGSKFDADGEMITASARNNLEKIDLRETNE